jgi:TonB family protein
MSMSRTRSATLLWALGASTVVHAGLVAMVALQGVNTPGQALEPAVVLQASVAPLSAMPQPLMTIDASPLALPAEPMALMPTLAPMQRVAMTRESIAVPAGMADGGFEDVRIVGALLQDRARLGDFYARRLGEFPREIDVPARLSGKIVAQYPIDALAGGIEGSVAVWAIVDETGMAAEVDVIDGPPALVQAAVAAVREARFLPARNNMKPIRFPIALEFRFDANDRGARVVARAAS